MTDYRVDSDAVDKARSLIHFGDVDTDTPWSEGAADGLLSRVDEGRG